jgi:FMN phosphatase YigB (HAD superfamily)
MAITTVMFDLDGTLLPMDLDVYLGYYFKLLIQKLVPFGYDPKKITDSINHAVAAMVENDGSRTNEEAFWDSHRRIMGDKDAISSRPLLEEFYRNEFQQVKAVCGSMPESKEILDFCRGKGLRVVLATSPLYPRVATESRIRWAELQPEDFDYITTYEDSHYCKPNPDYYREILNKLALSADECLMVGNDVREDMIARDVGMEVFLLPKDLINRDNKDISQYPHGDFNDLKAYIEKILG